MAQVVMVAMLAAVAWAEEEATPAYLLASKVCVAHSDGR